MTDHPRPSDTLTGDQGAAGGLILRELPSPLPSPCGQGRGQTMRWGLGRETARVPSGLFALPAAVGRGLG
jgi:hypothetical protein